MSRLIAIGDIHGCLAALDALLEAIGPQADDVLVPLGDYIDRGPDSCGVIDRLIELESHSRLVPLLGNHEEMMLSTRRGSASRGWWLTHGGEETLRSYRVHDDADERFAHHAQWLGQCHAYYTQDDWFFVHANYVASEPLDTQPAEALRWQSLAEHFPQQHVSGKRAVVGHTAQRSGELLVAPQLVAIDTYCHGGGWLTALDTRSGEVWQASRSGRLRANPPRLPAIETPTDTRPRDVGGVPSERGDRGRRSPT